MKGKYEYVYVLMFLLHSHMVLLGFEKRSFTTFELGL